MKTQYETRRFLVLRWPPFRFSWMMAKSSLDTCVKYGLPAHSPIAQTFGADVSRRSFTRMCPFFGQLDSGLLQADSLSIGRTPNRSENVRSFNRSHAAVTVELQSYLVSRNAFDIEKLAVQKDLNSFIFEKLQNSLREIWVLR